MLCFEGDLKEKGLKRGLVRSVLPFLAVLKET